LSKDNGERLVDAVEMSAMLSWSLDSLYRAVRAGWVPAYHLGPRLLRFDPAEVRLALKQKEGAR
jgi:predicted DNA-binding transcriptional regulator AlpA